MLIELTTGIKLKSFITSIFTAYVVLIGGYTEMTQALFILMILDFLLGFMKAWKHNNIRADKLKGGFIKMVGYALGLIVLYQITILTGMFDIMGFTLITFGTIYLAVNEGLSCLKHLNDFGFKLPKVVDEKLKTFKDNLDNNN